MKESIWGYGILILGVIAVGVIWFFGNTTRTDQHNYNLLKETTEAAMLDAVDLAAYRENGVVRIDEEKFVENFIRRFAQNAELTKSYVIEIYDVNETPPKVSLKVSSTSDELKINSNNFAEGEVFEFDIINNIDAILETKYGNVDENVNSGQENDSEKICKAVERGNFHIGQQYSCQVASGETYNFNVVGITSDKVSLLMNQNLNLLKNEDNPIASKRETKIKSLTQNWKVVARLPMVSEVKSCSNSEIVENHDVEDLIKEHYEHNDSDWDNYYFDFSSVEGCGWTYQNLSDSDKNDDSSPLAYWFDPKSTVDGKGFCMYSDGKLWAGANIYPAIECGIRPVITVLKTNCEN